MITFRFRTLLMYITLVCSVWQLGESGYLYAKAKLAQQLIKDAWQETLHNLQQNKPWPWADTWPVGRIKVPAHNIDLYVLAGDSGRTLAFAPGHRFDSALPGETGTILISAHRDTQFGFLGKLTLGEMILVQDIQGQWHHYKVNNSKVVDQSSSISATTDSDGLVLVTCYPFDAIVAGGPLRFIVFAEKLNKTLNSKEEAYFRNQTGIT
jgi:sortase A